MPELIGIDIVGFETIKQRLLKLPKEAQDAGVENANEYILNQMRAYPPKPSAPFVWSSDKQRRYVMAKLREQGGKGGRTQNLSQGWKAVGNGYKQILVNEVDYAKYVQDEEQIIGHKTNNWQKISDILKKRGSEILRKFDGGVKKAIKRLGL